ncbi:MAG: hypothetical protein ABEI75_03135 [Halobaculum sp.]
MSRAVDLLCLANSEKEGGRCVAGLDLDTGEWVRPVAETESGELYPRHYETREGETPRPLDVLRIYVESDAASEPQPENARLADQSWELRSRELSARARRRLADSVQTDAALFGDTGRQITTDAAESISESLTLVRPMTATLRFREREGNSDQLRCRFDLGGEEYDLPVTDPQWDRERVSEFDGVQTPSVPAHAFFGNEEELLCTISLGTEHEGAHYKLVAAMFGVSSELFSHSGSGV